MGQAGAGAGAGAELHVGNQDEENQDEKKERGGVARQEIESRTWRKRRKTTSFINMVIRILYSFNSLSVLLVITKSWLEKLGGWRRSVSSVDKGLRPYGTFPR
jgi:hypothetical protein